MTLNAFYEELDSYYKNYDFKGLEEFLNKVLNFDCGRELELAALNELVGLLRGLERHDEAVATGIRAHALVKDMKLANTIHEGTVMLNLATAMRCKEMYTESIELYGRVKDIYIRELADNDYRMASLYNNMSIVYEKLGNYTEAKSMLIKAMDIIVLYPEAGIELATSYVNLSQVQLLCGEKENAKKSIDVAMKMFEERKAYEDIHYKVAIKVQEMINESE